MRRRFMAVGFVLKDSDFPRHGQKLARQLLRGAGQGPRQADEMPLHHIASVFDGVLIFRHQIRIRRLPDGSDSDFH